MLNYTVRSIPHRLTYEWLLKKHYAHRLPQIQYSFGLYNGEYILKGVCCFGLPPNQNICLVCGEKYKDNFTELNRLILTDNIPNEASYFISRCFGMLPKPMIVVSYSDPNNGHHGYIYQALNALYTGFGGESKEYLLNGERINSRHVKDYWFEARNVHFDYSKDIDTQFRAVGGIVQEVEPKHRYIWLLGDKRQVRNMKNNFKWAIYPYPKGDNREYDASYEPVNQGVLF